MSIEYPSSYKRELENVFPGLANGEYKITSQETPQYNCIAWSFEENFRWWWPDQDGQYYWPNNVPRLVTLETFVRAYQ